MTLHDLLGMIPYDYREFIYQHWFTITFGTIAALLVRNAAISFVRHWQIKSHFPISFY